MWLFDRKEIRPTAVLLLALCLSACGFRLQNAGGYPEAMVTTYVSASDRYTPFYLQLVDSLEQVGITVTESPVDGAAMLRISRDRSSTRVLTISGRKVAREFDVTYSVSYSLIINEEELVARSLSRSQDFTYDAREVLGKKREEDNIRRALAEELVKQVNRDISTLN